MATTITMTNANGFDWLKVNGRYVEIAGRIEAIERVAAGKWRGRASGVDFEIVGGKASGGGACDWFVKFPLGYGDSYLPRKSAADCIRAIENV